MDVIFGLGALVAVFAVLGWLFSGRPGEPAGVDEDSPPASPPGEAADPVVGAAPEPAPAEHAHHSDHSDHSDHSHHSHHSHDVGHAHHDPGSAGGFDGGSHHH
jgi:hypothetical protein